MKLRYGRVRVWPISSSRNSGLTITKDTPKADLRHPGTPSPAGRKTSLRRWIWALETGEVLATFTRDGVANCCVFSDALELTVAGDAGGHVHFLHLEEPNHRADG